MHRAGRLPFADSLKRAPFDPAHDSIADSITTRGARRVRHRSRLRRRRSFQKPSMRDIERPSLPVLRTNPPQLRASAIAFHALLIRK
ncbi:MULTISPECIES: hypothetical protein [unclassified Burkholderia]|uniref:hypothetical protein n=1 Tax=unclassified Burkholderia TaxID=2613784 RepID=UPI000F55DAA0|nr:MULTISPECIES: hypothetical protein [unclassified Burkholderia]